MTLPVTRTSHGGGGGVRVVVDIIQARLAVLRITYKSQQNKRLLDGVRSNTYLKDRITYNHGSEWSGNLCNAIGGRKFERNLTTI